MYTLLIILVGGVFPTIMLLAFYQGRMDSIRQKKESDERIEAIEKRWREKLKKK